MLGFDIYENEELLNDLLQGKIPINKVDLISIVNTWGRKEDFIYLSDNYEMHQVNKQKPNGHLPLENIDISQIKNLSYVLYGSYYNGNLSKWNFSNARIIDYIFCNSVFNNNSLRNLDFINIKSATAMFLHSEFCGDVSGWVNYQNSEFDYVFHGNKNFIDKYNNGKSIDNRSKSFKRWLDENLDRIIEINTPKEDVLDYFNFDEESLSLER